MFSWPCQDQTKSWRFNPLYTTKCPPIKNFLLSQGTIFRLHQTSTWFALKSVLVLIRWLFGVLFSGGFDDAFTPIHWQQAVFFLVHATLVVVESQRYSLCRTPLTLWSYHQSPTFLAVLADQKSTSHKIHVRPVRTWCWCFCGLGLTGHHGVRGRPVSQ